MTGDVAEKLKTKRDESDSQRELATKYVPSCCFSLKIKNNELKYEEDSLLLIAS